MVINHLHPTGMILQVLPNGVAEVDDSKVANGGSMASVGWLSLLMGRSKSQGQLPFLDV